MNPESTSTAEASTGPRWRPLGAAERRVLGVLVEKAKTTPENYPLSLNALRAGCNQKSNRAPLMQLEESEVEEALDELRQLGAAVQVQGGGRVDRYRHLAYEWLGVEKVELAVMAELLLRGAQTVGELRGRAARMEPIKGLSELTPILDALQSKGLILFLTPPGRGSVVTHALYLDREIEKVRREAGAHHRATGVAPGGPPATGVAPGGPPVVHQTTEPSDAALVNPLPADARTLMEQLGALRDELAMVRREFEAARSDFANTSDELRRQLDDLNHQLGN